MSATTQQLLVDAMNVIGSRPDGWWRDRQGAIRRLVEELQMLADRAGAAIVVVIDGGPLEDLPEGPHDGVDVRYAARRGPDAADDRIVALLEEELDPPAWHVVTADRALRERVEGLGARVMGPRMLLDQLEGQPGR